MAPRSPHHGPPSPWRCTILLATVLFATLFAAAPAARAAVFEPEFPRLSIWWPNSDAQPLAQRARCDWTALQSNEGEHIAELHAANPNILVLGSINARELYYKLGNYNDRLNVEVRSVSTDWILTQVGSTLSSDISASATSIPVNDVTKFVAGDMVLVDHELMYVDAVGATSLTVRARGPVNPPAAHSSGARIAMVVSSWPGSISFDLSANCPKRDVGHGPETWGDWILRKARSVLDSSPWDGLFVDCLECNPSWIVGKFQVRTIDPLRSNAPVTDGYAAFNAAWNAGAGSLGDGLRVAAGQRPVIGNGNMRNFALNGTVFEDFPYTGMAPWIWDVVFVGPYAYPHASYPEWCASAARPNLSLVQVYGSATDYRAMRFGLCSTLMGDGYFTYARSGEEHAAAGLDWFDEFDNAGAGRGYLGQPIGPATKSGSAWRRDFAGGVALVNPSASAVTVQLGAAFRKIKGTQARTVNDGTVVTSVTIPARDGIVVLRIPNVMLTASGTSVDYGRETTLQAMVSQMSVSDVLIEKRAAGDTQWVAAATVEPDGSGRVTLAQAPSVSAEYRVRIVADGVVSNVVKVGVRPRITFRSSLATVRRGGRATFSGTVTGHHGHAHVSLQRYSGGHWRTVRVLATSSSGRYSTKVSLTTHGKRSYRVVLPTGTSHLSAVSSTVRITVR